MKAWPPLLGGRVNVRRADDLGAHVGGVLGGGLKGGERVAEAAVRFVVEGDEELEGVVAENIPAIEDEIVDGQAMIDDR
jgi:hypothetical protein